MAHYWDYSGTSSTSGNYYNPNTIWHSPSSTTTVTNTWSSNTPTYVYYTYIPVTIQRYLVESPAHWGDPEVAGFVRLLNDETKSHGFTVEMVITGDIKITDPTIQKRTMEEFVPLLRRYANAADRALIDKFFAQVPVTLPKLTE